MSDRGEDYADMLLYGEINMVGPEEQRAPRDIPVPRDDEDVSDWGTKLVDLKGVAKPPPFSGDDADWFEWKFRFTSVMGLLRVAEEMKFCAAMHEPVPFARLGPQAKQKSALLYNLLIALVKGRALAILRGVADSNGLEVWRQLVLEYEPQQAARYSQMLQGVLNPSWTSSLAFELDLREWEGSLRRYEEAAGVQVPDQIKSAVIAQHVPKAIKRFIKMVPADITADYATLKGAILAFLTRDRAYTPMGLALRDDDAMLVDAIDDDMQQEVNALIKGKGKGKVSGKNKGGKGSSSTATQEGWWMRPCRFCQGRHMDVMCPRQQAAGQAAQPRAPQNQQQAATPQPSGSGKGKGGNKGGGKGKGQGAFAGYCNRCGRWGHRSATCRVVMGVFDEIWNPKNGPVTSIHDSQGRLKTPRLLLVDSGAFIHTCPKEEFPEIPIKTDDKKNAPGAVVADGRPLHFYGTKTVNFKTFGDYDIKVKFFVSDVNRVILSVGQLKKDGHDVDFCGKPSIGVGQHRVALCDKGNLFHLPVRLPDERWSMSCNEHLAHQAMSVGGEINIVAPKNNDWKFFEYCCASDSLLASWFQRRGVEVQRLCLPDHDMSNDYEAKKLTDEIEDRTKRGLHSFVWIALTCTPWCQWQALNLQRGTAMTTANIEKERKTSLRLLEVLLKVVKKIRSGSAADNLVHLAFEWPRGSFGWRLKIVQELQKLMTYSTEFDGCCYGLVDQRGALLKKPWKVISTMPKIDEVLGRRCGHDHPHGLTHGLAAKISAYYTPAFADAVGAMILSEPQSSQYRNYYNNNRPRVPGASHATPGGKQGGGAAKTPRPRVPGESHATSGGKQGGGAAKTPGAEEEAAAEEEVAEEEMIGALPGVPTRLREKTTVEDEGHDPLREHARLANGEPLATAPSELEQSRHCLTHLPFAKWCAICVKARAKDMVHNKIKVKDGPDVVQFDYAFMRSGDEEKMVPVLIAITRRAGYAFASAVRAKGTGDVAVVDDILAWLREAGLTNYVCFRSDGEPAIRAVVEAVATRRGPKELTKIEYPNLMRIETTPVKSSSSLGGAERYAQTLGGMIRTLRMSLTERLNIDLNATSLAFNLLVIHANFLYNRYQVRANGLTPFEDQMGHSYHGKLFQWGQPVLVRQPSRARPTEDGRSLDCWHLDGSKAGSRRPHGRSWRWPHLVRTLMSSSHPERGLHEGLQGVDRALEALGQASNGR